MNIMRALARFSDRHFLSTCIIFGASVLAATATWAPPGVLPVSGTPKAMEITGYIDDHDPWSDGDLVVNADWKMNVPCPGGTMLRYWQLSDGTQVEAVATRASSPRLVPAVQQIVYAEGKGEFQLFFAPEAVPKDAINLIWEITSDPSNCRDGRLRKEVIHPADAVGSDQARHDGTQ
mgnify:CR=1 FL=1